MKVSVLTIVACVLLCSTGGAADFSGTVVQVHVTFQGFDAFFPWQKLRPGMRQGYGVAVDANHVVTTEALVRNCTLVEIRRASSGERLAAVVEKADHQANLALLRIPATARGLTLTPVSILEDLDRAADVQIVQFDETAQIQRGRAQVVRVAVERLHSSPHHSLTFVLLTDLNVNGQGAAVVHNDSLAGLVMRYDRGTRTAAVLPYCVVSRFMLETKRPVYSGMASAGVIWSPLVDPAKRSYLRLQADKRGILVLSCLPGTGAAEVLRPNDVIVSWDDTPVDNMGFYEDPLFGRLAFPYLIRGKRRPGDAVPVDIVRDGRSERANVALAHYADHDALIPDNISGGQDEYLVTGGLVLRELTGNYLRAKGSNWKRRADSRLVHLYLTRKYAPDNKGDRIVLLSSVLPDEINIGYQHLRTEIVTAANGKEIRNMRDLFRMQDSDGMVSALTLRGIDVDIVLDADTLPNADARIARLYRIPRLSHRHESGDTRKVARRRGKREH